MDLIVAIDNLILSFFTKISHKFYRLTGYTNFFLAKLAICVMTVSVMLTIFSYWFPAILGFRPLPINVAISSVLSILCLIDMVRCDQAEKSTFNDERVRMFNPLYYSPSIRVLWVFLASITIVVILPFLANGKGYFIFKTLFFNVCASNCCV